MFIKCRWLVCRKYRIHFLCSTYSRSETQTKWNKSCSTVILRQNTWRKQSNCWCSSKSTNLYNNSLEINKHTSSSEIYVGHHHIGNMSSMMFWLCCVQLEFQPGSWYYQLLTYTGQKWYRLLQCNKVRNYLREMHWKWQCRRGVNPFIKIQ